MVGKHNYDVGNGTNREPPSIPDHQLFTRIGHGSYGEVWLARNTTGAFRAIKIVHRSDFSDDRPYEREFTGLKHFEPLSRAHDGLVDILHLGRNDEAEFFYYVMEAADDASTGEEVAPNCYRPLTLEEKIRAHHGRLPVQECLQISLALAAALRFLHEARLVHRDIKPSNIIFVGSVPKLADVGLVALAESGRSFVGTEGFVPPEGPGTVQADLYSLGKVIYEMAMGKDRLAFPSPPTLLAEMPDRKELAEINELITKACEPKPDSRYKTAAQMEAELMLLEAGRSVKAARARRTGGRYAAAAAILIGVSALAWLWQDRQKNSGQPYLQVAREFALPGGASASGAKVGNPDGDREPRLVAGIEGFVVAVTLQGHTLWANKLHSYRGSHFAIDLVVDVNGDGKAELIVHWVEGTNLYVSVLNQRLYEIKRFQATGSMLAGPTGPLPWSEMTAAAFLPGTTNEPARLVVDVSTGYPKWPRYLRCYNFTNDSVLWEYPMASSFRYLVPCDLNRDGKTDFLVGTYASSNGAVLLDGRDDAHSYVIALSNEGQPLWTNLTGGVFTVAQPQVCSCCRGRIHSGPCVAGVGGERGI